MARILLIEPDRLLGTICLQALTKAGHDVDWVKTAEQGVLSLDRQIVDLVVLELLLAVHNGVEFLYEMRSYPEWQHIPVILHTNIQKNRLPQPALQQLAITAHLYKPDTSLRQLVDQVDSVLVAT